MRPALIPILLLKLLFDLLSATAVSATAIIVIRTAEEIIAAADSKSTITLYPDWQRYAFENCKIRKLHDTLYFAASGLTNDYTQTLNVETAIRNSYKKSASVSQTVEVAEALIKSSFLEALNRQKREHPEIFKKNFSKDPYVDFALFGFERGAGFVHRRRLGAQDDKGGLSVKLVDFENCPPLCKDPGEITLLGERDTMKEYIDKLGPVTALTDLQIAESTVRVAIARNPETVGPPIDILRIDRRGAEWIKVKNMCR
jgi:hypothetical protein